MCCSRLRLGVGLVDYCHQDIYLSIFPLTREPKRVRPGFASSSRDLAQHAADHHAAQPTQPPAPRLGRGLLAGVRLACRSQTHAGRADDVRRRR
eukprot:scaffold129013_cov63-Phaeocystis_antarctica.AAC.1